MIKLYPTFIAENVDFPSEVSPFCVTHTNEKKTQLNHVKSPWLSKSLLFGMKSDFLGYYLPGRNSNAGSYSSFSSIYQDLLLYL